MERYTIAERTKIDIYCLENNQSIIKTQRGFRRCYDVKTAPTANTIHSVVNNFGASPSVIFASTCTNLFFLR